MPRNRTAKRREPQVQRIAPEQPKPHARRTLPLRSVSSLPEPPKAKWFAAHTKAGKEHMVNLFLRERQWFTFYPQRRVRVTHARKTEEVMRPYLSRYVFFQALPHQDALDVNAIEGVSTVLWGADGPLVIGDRDIAVLMAKADRDGVIPDDPIEETPKITFEPGTKVRVIADGPFRDFVGIVSKMDGASYVSVEFALFGRVTKTSVPASWVTRETDQ